jgi:hypothetical protein
VADKQYRIYFVLTPEGVLSEASLSTRARDALGKFLHEVVPDDVKLNPLVCDALWSKFSDAGYRMASVPVPDASHVQTVQDNETLAEDWSRWEERLAKSGEMTALRETPLRSNRKVDGGAADGPTKPA